MIIHETSDVRSAMCYESLLYLVGAACTPCSRAVVLSATPDVSRCSFAMLASRWRVRRSLARVAYSRKAAGIESVAGNDS